MTQMMIYLHYGISKPTYEGKALNIIKKEPLADNGKDDKYTEDSSTEDLNKHVYVTTFMSCGIQEISHFLQFHTISVVLLCMHAHCL